MIFLMKILLMGSLSISVLHAAGEGEGGDHYGATYEDMAKNKCGFHEFFVGEWEHKDSNKGFSILYTIDPAGGPDLNWYQEINQVVASNEGANIVCTVRSAGFVYSCIENASRSVYNVSLEDRTKELSYLVEDISLIIDERSVNFPSEECNKYFLGANELNGGAFVYDFKSIEMLLSNRDVMFVRGKEFNRIK
ncbi:MAG: hypothetical protein OXB84_03955 [Halobacteriovoraceae bacterium]|nr:hypothetical protein [Halobacteriovoraceae bacterium]